MSENKMATKEDLKEFYNRIYPYLGGSAAAGFTPIGTIIPMIAETAPANYLICDGTAYNKSDYPELAAHLLSMTSHSMYEVSGDATKFKVPDLRGEFLRGTGTNSHSGNGNGATVGTHQDSTKIPRVWSGGAAAIIPKDVAPANVDNNTAQGSASYLISTSENNGYYEYYTARPTNTSVLYCIATKDIYLDPRNMYSTSERVVGEWIDGSTIYQKTFVGISMPTVVTDETPVAGETDIESLNIKDIIDIEGIMYSTSGTISYQQCNMVYIHTKPQFIQLYINKSTKKIVITSNSTQYNGRFVNVTIQYTKATS